MTCGLYSWPKSVIQHENMWKPPKNVLQKKKKKKTLRPEYKEDIDLKNYHYYHTKKVRGILIYRIIISYD